jgi:hypothetical protein
MTYFARRFISEIDQNGSFEFHTSTNRFNTNANIFSSNFEKANPTCPAGIPCPNLLTKRQCDTVISVDD